jgi:hypothetical protein
MSGQMRQMDCRRLVANPRHRLPKLPGAAFEHRIWPGAAPISTTC